MRRYHRNVLFALLALVALFLAASLPASAQKPDLVWMRGGITNYAYATAYSPDGKLIATADGFDTTLKLWRVSDGMLLHTFWMNNVNCVGTGFTPDGSQVMSVDAAGNINFWKVTDGSLVKTITVSSASPVAAALSPDGTLVATANAYDNAQVFRVSNGTLLWTFPEPPRI